MAATELKELMELAKEAGLKGDELGAYVMSALDIVNANVIKRSVNVRKRKSDHRHELELAKLKIHSNQAEPG